MRRDSLLCALWLAATLVSSGAREGHAALFTVNATDDREDGACDSVHCNLREALRSAHASSGADTIRFALGGPPPHTIRPVSPLPALADADLLDGTSQPGADEHPAIQIDGIGAGATDGLILAGTGAEVRGLTIGRFAGAGVRILGANARVIACYLGTDSVGVGERGNGTGVVVESSAQGSVVGGAGVDDGNLVAFNRGDGVRLVGALAGRGTTVLSNRIQWNVGAGIRHEPGQSADSGPPVPAASSPLLDSVVVAGEVLEISGRWLGPPGREAVLQLFASAACDASGRGEGQRLLGTLSARADAAGEAGFVWTARAPIAHREYVTATATDSEGRTSEFSLCRRVALRPAPDAAAPRPLLRIEGGAPNPFRRQTAVRFELAEPVIVSAGVYDAKGRRLRSLARRAPMIAGRHTLLWDGLDDDAKRAQPGVYFVQLQGARETRQVRVVLTD